MHPADRVPGNLQTDLGIWADPGLWTDLYHPDAAYIAWMAGRNPVVTFDVTVRRAPFGGDYMVAAGINAALRFIAGFHYGPEALGVLRDLGYPAAYLAELAQVRFTGTVMAIPEGRLVFPDEPIIRVTAPFRAALIIESGILNAINTATLIATKAARIVQAAGGRPVAEFGFRRAQSPLVAAYAARIGGCASTSLLAAAHVYQIPSSGTIPHALIELFPDQESAFKAVATAHEQFRLLLDTYDTLHGARIAARVGIWARSTMGHTLIAVRLDSGDLASLSQQVRGILDDAGLPTTQILVSGDLDEWRIAELVASGAPIDGFGVGTALVNGVGSVEHGTDGGALGGVYKLAWVNSEDGTASRPVIKLAGSKTTWPGIKQVARADQLTGDVIQIDGESLPAGYHRLLLPAIEGTQILAPFLNDLVEDAAERARRDLAQIPAPYRTLHPSEAYPVRYSQALQLERARALAAIDRQEPT